MIELSIIFLIIHYIGLIVFKPKLNSLYCGIWGFIGDSQLFNKFKFDILGIYNDTRGGDSCGLFMGHNDKSKQLLYGINDTKFYKNFVEKENRYDADSIKFALGHARKASVGGISLEKAQPIVITDKKGQNPVFVMIHNGTLVNHEELAKKYDVEFDTKESDSQIFARIVHKVGYGVLAEYEGAGAFVFWDRRDGHDTIRMFKGASLYYNNDDKIYIERPLYWICKDKGLWFSSMEDSLRFINDDFAKIGEVPYNTLLTIKNGVVIDTQEIDRSTKKQLKVLAYKGGYAGNFHVRNWGGNRFDEDIDCFAEYGYERDRFQEVIEKREEETKKAIENADGTGIELATIDRSLYLTSFNINGIKPDPHKHLGKVFFDVDGLYKNRDGSELNGPVELTYSGFLRTEDNRHSFDFNTFYFVNGVLMRSYIHYLCAIKYTEDFDKTDELYPCYLAKYSAHPIPILTKESGIEENKFYYNKEGDPSDSILLFDGCFSPFFSYSNIVYYIKDGVITRGERYSDTPMYKVPADLAAIDSKIFKNDIKDKELEELIKKYL